ncbi:hypothetical protein AAC387_Pa06g1533 [Persea americana]
MSPQTHKPIMANLQLIKPSPIYGSGIQNPTLLASFETNERLRVQITDSDHHRWEVPHDVIPRQANLHHLHLPENHRNILEYHQFSSGNYLSIPESNLILT